MAVPHMYELTLSPVRKPWVLPEAFHLPPQTRVSVFSPGKEQKKVVGLLRCMHWKTITHKIKQFIVLVQFAGYHIGVDHEKLGRHSIQLSRLLLRSRKRGGVGVTYTLVCSASWLRTKISVAL